MKDRYFEVLSAISKSVHSFIAKKISDGQTQSMIEKMAVLPNARKEKGIMRSLLTKLIFDALSKRKANLVPAMALSELSNVYAYLFNIVLDNKNGIYDDEKTEMVAKINTIAVTAPLFREIYEEVLMGLSISERAKLQLLRDSSAAMARSAQGQETDLELTISKIDQFDTDEEYLDYYIEKSRLQSGYLYGLSAQIGAVMAKASAEETLLAREIGEVIGIGLHMSNDLGDFAVMGEGTGFKVYQDQFADLRNGRLSLPIYWVLRHGTAAQKALFLAAASGEAFDAAAVLRALHESGAYTACKKLLNRYERQAKALIHQLPESESRSLLSTMASAIRSNKYLVALRQETTPAS